MEEIGIWNETYLFSISYNFVTVIHVYFLDKDYRSPTWRCVFSSCSACISFFRRSNLVTNIENQKSICLLIHHHYVITKPELSVSTVGMWNSSKSFGKSFLSLVDHKHSLSFLVQIVSLFMGFGIDIFRPVTNSGMLGISGSSW